MEFDPLACPLSLMGSVTIATSLPASEQWREVDRLVLAGSRPGVPPVLPKQLSEAATAAGRSGFADAGAGDSPGVEEMVAGPCK